MKDGPGAKNLGWHENEGASRRVTALIEESGALLEAQVSDMCQSFVEKHDKKQGTRIATDVMTYGKDTAEDPLREIDQHLSLYKEFVLDERTGVQLQTDILIEAKFRKDVEVFGVLYPTKAYRPRMPLTAFLKGSQLSANLEAVTPFRSVPLVRPIHIEIKDGKTPNKASNEALVHKSASAIYDFVQFELSGYASESVDPGTDRILTNMGLPQRFEKYLAEKHYAWWSVLFDWMRENITDTLCDEFNRRLGAGRVYYSIHGYVPVAYINGRAWTVKGRVFNPAPILLTRVRVPRWPGQLRPHLLRYSIEAPLLITNPVGLHEVLDESLTWFLLLEKALRAADREIVRRWPIESAFYRLVLAKSLRDEHEIRSDIEIFTWI